MATPKSPFLVIQNFISPKVCEQIVDGLEFYTPDMDPEGNPIKMYKFNEKYEQVVFERFQPLIPKIMEHYDAVYRGTTQITFEYLAEGTASEPICENSQYIRKKWTRTKDRDFTAVLMLSDYNENVPFDSDYEVYGGKLEFPQHGFGFQPERGTLIVYPSGPHFINANAAIEYGDLFQARIHVCSQAPYMYNPQNFPGNFTNWFNDLE